MKVTSIRPSEASLFQLRLSNPKVWLQRSKSLVRSANVMWPSVKQELSNLTEPTEEESEAPVLDVCLMLVGYACELGIKARIVHKLQRGKPHQIIGDEMIPPELKSHNLISLCKTANLHVDSQEEDALKLLSKTLLWRGRYPIPTNATALTPTYFLASRINRMAAFLSRVSRGHLCLRTND